MTNLEEMAKEIQELRDIVKGLADCSPFPEPKDGDGTCYFCGGKFEMLNSNTHNSLCVWRRAVEEVSE